MIGATNISGNPFRRIPASVKLSACAVLLLAAFIGGVMSQRALQGRFSSEEVFESAQLDSFELAVSARQNVSELMKAYHDPRNGEQKRREILFALGIIQNSSPRHSDAFDALLKIARDSNDSLRFLAIVQLGTIMGIQFHGSEVLDGFLLREADVRILSAALNAGYRLSGKTAFEERLLALMNGMTPDSRMRVVRALCLNFPHSTHGPSIELVLRIMYLWPDDMRPVLTRYASQSIQQTCLVLQFIEFLHDKNPLVRAEAYSYLKNVGGCDVAFDPDGEAAIREKHIEAIRMWFNRARINLGPQLQCL